MGNVDGVDEKWREASVALAQYILPVIHGSVARTVVQIACGQELVALADDGTVWHMDWDAREWRPLPALPKRERGAA